MYYDHPNVNRARKFRKDMTPWERKLWYCFLRQYPVRFYRQKPIGSYIVDFFCPKAGIIVELDGSGHYYPEKQNEDSIRTEKLEIQGYTIIRFSNKDIDQNFYGVCTFLDNKIKEKSPKIRERQKTKQEDNYV